MVLLGLAALLSAVAGYSVCPRAPASAPRRATATMALPDWVPAADTAAIDEAEAQAAFDELLTVSLELPSHIATGPVPTTYLRTSVQPRPDVPPLLLLHGFDISCLEFRRLLPQLEAAGIEAYAPCVAGWGFTDTTHMRSVGVEAKRAQLLAFADTILGGRPAVWVGASLGACIALDCYKAKPSAVSSLVALDPGFFTDAPPAVPGTPRSDLHVLRDSTPRIMRLRAELRVPCSSPADSPHCAASPCRHGGRADRGGASSAQPLWGASCCRRYSATPASAGPSPSRCRRACAHAPTHASEL